MDAALLGIKNGNLPVAARNEAPLSRHGGVYAYDSRCRRGQSFLQSVHPWPTHYSATVRRPTHIVAQPLGSALNQLAQSRGLQVLYLSNTVRDLRTHGGDGDITANEAFDQLLDGTGLTYRYLDGNTVTVMPITSNVTHDGAGAGVRSPNDAPLDAGQTETKPVPSKRYVLAGQVVRRTAASRLSACGSQRRAPSLNR